MLAARGPDAGDVLAGLPVAVLVVDPDGLVARANGACEALLNRSERAMAGQRIDALVTLPDEARGGGDVSAFDVEVATAGGGRVRVDLIQAALADHSGWRTVTLHPVASAHGLVHAGGRGAAGRAAVGAAAMLAHEIKNPLSGIRGAAQLIEDGAEAGELTRLIVSEVDRIAALIDRMEDFTDTRPLAIEPLNIYPLLAHARDVARAGFARGIAFEERYDPSLPLAAGNRDALLQVMLNLLGNAANALGGRGERRIVVTTAYRHGMSRDGRGLPIEICVIDSGPGAPEDIAGQLFDPFVSGRPEGKGLGLALVDKLVRGMGGAVSYAREGDPHMTVFRVLLPRAE